MKLVFTNNNCSGCNKCIAFFDVSEHQAREFQDDMERFFED